MNSAHAEAILAENVVARGNLYTEIANSLQWRRLLHFNDEGEGTSYAQYAPEGKKFFLAGENGRNDPGLELAATVEAFNSPIPKSSEAKDAHARCQFPARFMFLQEHLPHLQKLAPIECPRFARFASVLVPEQVDLVFAAAYVNSPASMYGHTLLRLKRKGKTKGNELLDYIVAFGANTQGASGLSYVINGLSGGFTGEFTTVPYYLKIREYLHMESRDLWSYPIHLSREEKFLLVAHLWELRLVQFPYYFLGANCSFFLLRFLEAVRPEWNFTNLMPDWVIPVDTIRMMLKSEAIGSGTVRASRLSRLLFLRERLEANEKDIAYAIVRSDDFEEAHQGLQELPDWKQAEVVDTAYEYFRYRNPLGSEGKKDQQLIAREQAILKLRASLPKQRVDIDGLRAIDPPESAHKSNRFALNFGVFESVNQTEFVRLAWRPALHDLLGDMRGLDPYAEQEVLHLRAQIEPNDGVIFLDTLNLLRVRSLAPMDPWFSRIAWRMTFGLAQAKDQRPHCRDWNCVYGRLEGGAGAAIEIDSDSRSFFFSLLTLNIHAGAPFNPNYRIGAGLETGLRLSPLSWLGLLGEWKWQEFFWGDSRDYSTFSGELSLRLRSNMDLRFRGEWVQDNHELSVGAFVYY